MAMRVTRGAMDLSKFLVRFARDTSHNTLEGVRGMLVNSLAWSAEQLGGMSAVPLIEQTGLARTLRNSSAASASRWALRIASVSPRP